MSTIPYPGPYPANVSDILVHHITTTPASQPRARLAAPAIRRRPSVRQGHSLEVLGHAIEYLVDSQLFLDPAVESSTILEASQILMRLSREVFAECPAVPSGQPFMYRFKKFLSTV